MVSKRELELRVELLEEKVKNIIKPNTIDNLCQEVYIPGRAQGNTVRGILRAILHASAEPNANVFYVAHNDHYANDLYRKAMDSVYGLIGGSSTFVFERNLITFPNGSRLQFIGANTLNKKYFSGLFMGLKNLKVIYDHHAH